MTGFRFDNIVGDTGDLVMIQGKTCYFTLVWGNTTPVDVTGFTAKLVAKKSPSATSKILECTIANGRVAIGGSNGRITFTVTASDSANLVAPQFGVYEIEVTTASGIVHRVITGRFSLIAEIAI